MTWAAHRFGMRGQPGRETRTEGRRRPRGHRLRAPLWARLAVGAGTLLIVVSGGSLVAGKALVAHYSAAVVHEGGLGAAAAKVDSRGGTAIAGPLNLLLVGIDERAGEAAMGARADSIIVAHVPGSHDAAYLVSIPRDTRVTIPADPAGGYPGGVDKVNAAFQFGSLHGRGRDGGLALLAQTVSGLTGGRLTFNGAAIVNFDGLRGLVRAIGGVRMYVDEQVTSVHIGHDLRTGREGVPYHINEDGTPGGLKPHMQPQVYDVGWHDFSDWQALDYVRQRDLLADQDGDYGRQRHQQQFLKAVLAKVTSTGVLTNPLKVNAVLSSLGKALSFYNNKVDLLDWIFTLKAVTPGGVTMIKTNDGRFNPETIDGVAYEELSPDSRQLLAAMADDQVPSFIATHPSWVAA
jgi:polyisoprenyl-teichoic acid--peptidoglycan teichoic acid transferase